MVKSMVCGAMAAALLVCLVVVAAGPAAALHAPEDLCASSKLKATGKKALGKLKCHAKAVQTSTDADAECLTKADTKLASAFAKAELKGGCISVGDEAAVQDGVDTFVARMVMMQTAGDPFPPCTQAMGPCGDCGDGLCLINGAESFCISQGSVNDGVGCISDTQCTEGEYCVQATATDTVCGAPCGTVVVGSPLDRAESACASSKLKATGKKTLGKFKCHAKAIHDNVAIDPECLAKAETKFSGAFAKAEYRGGCIFDGDEAAVEQHVDELVDGMVTRQVTPIIIEPLPSCTQLGATCGTCGDGYCLDHVPGPGCVSIGSIVDGFGCTSDTQCTLGKYCMHVFDLPLPFPGLPEWACAASCS